MSQKMNYSIQCPKCSKEQEAELYESISVQTDPLLKDQLLRNQLNLVRCVSCGFAFRVDKPLLYSDIERRLMIYLIPVRGGTVEEGCRQFGECLKRVNQLLPKDVEVPNLHLVFSQVELVERIFLVEAGLNERVVEYIKHLIYTRNAGKLDPRQKILLFNAEDSTPETLYFVVQDAASRKLESVVQYSREAYQGLLEMFDSDEHTPSLLELFPGPYISARQVLLLELESEKAEPKD